MNPQLYLELDTKDDTKVDAKVNAKVDIKALLGPHQKWCHSFLTSRHRGVPVRRCAKAARDVQNAARTAEKSVTSLIIASHFLKNCDSKLHIYKVNKEAMQFSPQNFSTIQVKRFAVFV